VETLLRIGKDILSLILPPRRSEALLAGYDNTTILSKFSPIELAEGFYALSSYKDPLVAAVIWELKYRKSARAAALLGAALKDALTTLGDDVELGHVEIVPVPLSEVRLKSRGFNQIELVLRETLPLPHHSYSHALLKTRETKPQTKLPRRARLENLSGAFSVSKSIDSSHTYVVVDDVTTTGATLMEGKRALQQAGARDIVLIAFAH